MARTLHVCFSILFLMLPLALSAPFKTYIISVRRPDAALLASSDGLHNYYKSFLPHSIKLGDEADLAESRLVHSYDEVFSGFSATLTSEELEEMKKKPGFLRAFPNLAVPLHTTRTPSMLGLQSGRGLWDKRTNLGEGVIIGMMDSGISPGHPSFDAGDMPPPPPKWKSYLHL